MVSKYSSGFELSDEIIKQNEWEKKKRKKHTTFVLERNNARDF